MGFFARNITSGPSVDVDINDLGLTVRVGEDYDLSTVSPNEVQNSTDLQDAINGSQVVILSPEDDTTPLSIADSLGVVTAANIPHFGITGGATLDQMDDVDLTTTPPTDPQTIVWNGSQFVPGDKVRWLNTWAPGTYKASDMVLDEPWTMIANKTTTDRAAPQLEDTGYTLPDDIPWVTNNQSTVVSGQEYTIDSDALFEINKYRVYLPTDSTTTSYIMALDDVTSGRVEIDRFTIPESVAPGWFERQISAELNGPGKKIQVLLYAARFGGAEFNNVYQYFDDGLPPATGEITSDLSTFSYVYASKTDKNSNPVNLSTLATGSEILIVESSALDRFQLWQSTGAVVDAGTYWNIPAELLDTNKTVRNNTQVNTEINEPEGVNADYVVNTNYWASNTIEGATTTGVIGTTTSTISTNNNAYGADIFGGAYTVSDDWDVVALSSGRGSGAAGIGDAPIDGTSYVRQDADWLPSGLDFRDPTQTGLIEGGLVSIASATTIDITAGSGFIMNSYDDPLNTTKTEVFWSAFTGITVNQPNNVGYTSIAIDSTGSVVQVDGLFTNSQLRTLIELARVYYEAGTLISVAEAPRIVNQTANTFYDLVRFLSEDALTKGIVVKKVNNQLSVFRSSGLIFVPGIEWDTDRTDPNEAILPAAGNETTPAVFDVVLQDGTIYLSGQTVIPKFWDDGTPPPAPVAGKNAVIHYLFENQGGLRYLQLGQTVYPSYTDATESLFSDFSNMNFFPNAPTAGFTLLAQILISGNSSDFEDSSNAGINNFLSSKGSSAGPGSNTDELVKVTANDTEVGYLSAKTAAGSGINLNVLNPGLNEQLEISAAPELTNFREPTQTGLISGGAVTQASATTIDVTAGTGFIMDSYTNPLVASKTDVSWSAFTGVVVTQTNPVGFTSITIDSTGTIVQIDGPLTNPQERTLIEISRVYYEAGSIIDVLDAPRVVNQTANAVYDYFNFISDSSTAAKGLSVQKVDNPPALSIFRGSGEFFFPGVNWPANKTDPNVLAIPADGSDSTPASFDVIFRDGTIAFANQTVIPKFWDDGTLTPNTLGTGQATIHYIFENAGGVRYLQLGQVIYGNYTQAAERLFNDATNFQFFPNASTGGFLLLAQIPIQGNAVDFENTARIGINNILGEGGISSGPGAETDEKVKVTAADTVTNYLNDKMTAGTGIQLNVTNPAANELLEVALGDPLQIAQLTGADSATSEPMLFITDTTRGNKVLSVESTQWLYGQVDTILGTNIWPVQAMHNAIGYVSPFDGTIIRASAYSDSVNVTNSEISVVINDSTAGTILTFPTTGEGGASNTDLNIDFSAGDRLRLEMSLGGLDDVAVSLWVKWRKV